MVITHVIGGLGNQMFQYAVGRALSIRNRVPLKLDIGGFASNTIHQGFELKSVFVLPAEIARLEDIRSTLGWQSSPIALRLLARTGARLLRCRRFIVEPYFQYFSGITLAPPACYLRGYWQSERYFSEFSDVIRADFSFRYPMSEENRRVADAIGAVNSVSLHVRRGDYITNHQNLSVHGVCSLEYYESAITCIAKRVSSPIFFIFSDDIDWVRDALRIEHPCYFVSHNRGSESYNDMRLMSLCSHNVIANSTFSWWGAWLNPNPDKIVIAPKRWFVREAELCDLFPKNWILI